MDINGLLNRRINTSCCVFVHVTRRCSLESEVSAPDMLLCKQSIKRMQARLTVMCQTFFFFFFHILSASALTVVSTQLSPFKQTLSFRFTVQCYKLILAEEFNTRQINKRSNASLRRLNSLGFWMSLLRSHYNNSLCLHRVYSRLQGVVFCPKLSLLWWSFKESNLNMCSIISLSHLLLV